MTGSSPDGQAPDADTAELLSAIEVPLGGELLERALMHRSFAYENGGLPTNERLEFLGDSVLGLIVTDTLFQQYPDLPEGQLAKLRAAVVNMRALAGVARGLKLGAYVRLGKGEEGTGGRDKSSILADTLEAVIGAVYLDQGLDGRRRSGAPAVRPGDRALGAAGRRAWTGRPRSRSSPRPRSWACPSTTSTRAARITRSRSAPRCGSAPRPTARARAGPRRKPSSRPPRRPGRRSARAWPRPRVRQRAERPRGPLAGLACAERGRRS